ncbi:MULTISPECIES: hypothetical protein [Methylobacterium]|uniref:hypothetical protein n=2 Tax=Methylobacteriaceae TaxID=119045 RepID=UPI000B881B65|nr:MULTISPECIES: hypothetical protein [Methylobacterium]MBK3400769.1 hypothetical protein [Methylobacterium ajmalii]MBK3412822.1 hypothetical protein [Methylobacterium ajmalii]MBZ6416793.1 hypothetical protein [Methylobacterium sp.]
MALLAVVAALTHDFMMFLAMDRLATVAMRLPALDDVAVALRAVVVGMADPDLVEGAGWPCRGPEPGRGDHEQSDLQQPRHLVISILARRLKKRSWP